MARAGGYAVPYLLKGGIIPPFFQEYGQHRNLPVVGLMHKMHFHIERASVYRVLARAVEMELEEVIFMRSDRHITSGIVIDLNGVAVIYNINGRAVIVRFDRMQVVIHCARDIYRRLMFAFPAICILGRQVTPVVGALVTAIAPVRPSTRCLGELGNEKQYAKNCCYDQD